MTGPYPGTVAKRGTDTSGRPILMSDALYVVHLCFLTLLGPLAEKTYVSQGSWMKLAGGGAKDSASVHNEGGALDYSIKAMTVDEVEEFTWQGRQIGLIIWPRGPRYGQPDWDYHAHAAAPWDTPVNSNITWQGREYVADRDGLLSRRPDYMRRPSPLILTPPKEITMAGIADLVEAAVTQSLKDNAGDAVWTHRLQLVGEDVTKPAGRVLTETHNRAGFTRDTVKQIARDVAVDVGGQIDPKQLEASLEKALGKALAAAGDELTPTKEQ